MLDDGRDEEGDDGYPDHIDDLDQEMDQLTRVQVEVEQESSEDESQGGDGRAGSRFRGKRLSQYQQAPHERYFALMKESGKSVGSSQAQLPVIDTELYLNTLRRSDEWTPDVIKKGQALLMKNYLSVKYSQEIISQAFHGFNTLLQGYGSKRSILNNIVDRLRRQGQTCVVINGFFPGLRVVQMVNDIARFVNVSFEKGSALTAAELTSRIAERYSRPQASRAHLFVIIHSIDAEPVRSPVFQSTFAKLAGASRIHFVASSDHINAPLLWPPPLDDQFGWMPRNATTFIPYDLELRFDLLGGSVTGVKGSREGGSSGMVGSGGGQVSGIAHVMEALPDKSIKLFQILAQYLLQNSEGQTLDVMSFDNLFKKASEEFLAQRPELLRTMLNDFKDHEIIVQGRAPDGTETLAIPLQRGTLQQLVETLSVKYVV